LTDRSRYRLTPAADSDIAEILAQTRTRFGTRQHDAYAALIASALDLAAREPARFGSKDRGDLEDGVRSFPLSSAAKRRLAAAHVLYYRVVDADGEGIEVLRVLHRSMDPRVQLPGTQE
jgi:toxin ParE1/3/4